MKLIVLMKAIDCGYGWRLKKTPGDASRPAFFVTPRPSFPRKGESICSDAKSEDGLTSFAVVKRLRFRGNDGHEGYVFR